MSEASTSTVDEGAKPAWMAQLSDDLKSNESLTRFQSISDLGKAFIDADGKLKNAVVLPREGASDSERAEFYAKLGRPESPEKYQLQRPKLPEGMNYDEGTEKLFRAEAHKLCLTQEQMEGLYAVYNAVQQQAFEAAQKQSAENRKAVEESLRKEWDKKYDENLELARRAVIALGGQKLKDELDKSGLGDNPELAKVFAALGAKMAPDKLVFGDKVGEKDNQAIPKTFTYPNL